MLDNGWKSRTRLVFFLRGLRAIYEAFGQIYQAFGQIYEAFGQIYEAFRQIYELRGCDTGLSYHTPLVVHTQACKDFPAPCCSGV